MKLPDKAKKDIYKRYKKKEKTRRELAGIYAITIDRVNGILRENGIYKEKWWDYEKDDKPLPAILIKPYVADYKKKKISATKIAEKTGLNRKQVTRYFYRHKIKQWDAIRKPYKRPKLTTNYQRYAKMIADYLRRW